jgi:hypothetical protein
MQTAAKSSVVMRAREELALILARALVETDGRRVLLFAAVMFEAIFAISQLL